MTGTVAVGMIGIGRMGGHHAHNLVHHADNAQVQALMDTDEGRLQDMARACGAPLTFTDPHALIDHPEVDAVLIAAPDRFHAALARACIEAGKPVLVEKPLATRVQDAAAVVAAEQGVGRRLIQVGFMRQYDPAHTAVKRQIEDGSLGTLLVFRSLHASATTGVQQRVIADIMTNSLIHDIHSARWMTGEEVVRVFAQVLSRPDQPGTARYVLVQLQFESGALGLLEYNDRADYGYRVEVRVSCARGEIETDALQGPVITRGGQRGRQVDEDWHPRFQAAYRAEIRTWLEGVLAGCLTGPTAWAGLKAQVIAESCIESAHRAQPVEVPVSDMPDLYRA